MAETVIITTPFSWYESFYKERVLVKIGKDMGEDLEGFFSPYLSDHAPDLYIKIKASEKEVDSLWLSAGSKESFKTACRGYYDRLMEAKKGFEEWKAKQRESVLNVGKQEAMKM